MDATSTPIKSGMLGVRFESEHRPNRKEKWKRRYVELRSNGSLQYFRVPKFLHSLLHVRKSKEELLGATFLSDAVVFGEQAPPISRKNKSFASRKEKKVVSELRYPFTVMVGTDGLVRLSACSASDRKEWVAALKAIIERYRQQQETPKTPRKQKSTDDERPTWEIPFEKLTFLNKIGEGVFGEVYHAELWGTSVAVKMLKGSKDYLDIDAKTLQELQQEAAILQMLRHPHVMLYMGASLEPPNVCMVTEWCERGNLFDLLHRSLTPLSFATMLRMMKEIARGMNYLHSLPRKIIHRDLKSHNLLVDGNLVVKIADFGLSHVRQRVQTMTLRRLRSDKTDYLTSHKGHYGIRGTPEWMAPEMLQDKKYNHMVDVYSYGIVLTEIVTRQLPFRHRYNIKRVVDVIQVVLEKREMPYIPPWCGTKISHLIHACLNHEPSQRPSFAQIIQMLEDWFGLAESRQLFETYDLPRLHHMLNSGHTRILQLALTELAEMNRGSAIETFFMVSDKFDTSTLHTYSGIGSPRRRRNKPGRSHSTATTNTTEYAYSSEDSDSELSSCLESDSSEDDDEEAQQRRWALQRELVVFAREIASLLVHRDDKIRELAARALARLLEVAKKSMPDRLAEVTELVRHSGNGRGCGFLLSLLRSRRSDVRSAAKTVLDEVSTHLPQLPTNEEGKYELLHLDLGLSADALGMTQLSMLANMVDTEVLQLERRIARMTASLLQKRILSRAVHASTAKIRHSLHARDKDEVRQLSRHHRRRSLGGRAPPRSEERTHRPQRRMRRNVGRQTMPAAVFAAAIEKHLDDSRREVFTPEPNYQGNSRLLLRQASSDQLPDQIDEVVSTDSETEQRLSDRNSHSNSNLNKDTDRPALADAADAALSSHSEQRPLSSGVSSTSTTATSQKNATAAASAHDMLEMDMADIFAPPDEAAPCSTSSVSVSIPATLSSGELGSVCSGGALSSGAESIDELVHGPRVRSVMSRRLV